MSNNVFIHVSENESVAEVSRSTAGEMVGGGFATYATEEQIEAKQAADKAAAEKAEKEAKAEAEKAAKAEAEAAKKEATK